MKNNIKHYLDYPNYIVWSTEFYEIHGFHNYVYASIFIKNGGIIVHSYFGELKILLKRNVTNEETMEQLHKIINYKNLHNLKLPKEYIKWKKEKDEEIKNIDLFLEEDGGSFKLKNLEGITGQYLSYKCREKDEIKQFQNPVCCSFLEDTKQEILAINWRIIGEKIEYISDQNNNIIWKYTDNRNKIYEEMTRNG